MKTIISSLFILSLLVFACSEHKLEKKGFSVSDKQENRQDKGISKEKDTFKFRTRPRNVLLTHSPQHRLTPLYKVNYDKKTKKYFTGSNEFHWKYRDETPGNNWHQNFMPGFKAVYGYNMVNISHYNTESKTKNSFFEKPVLIRTLYYPAPTNDTLNFQPVSRNYYMVSVYDEDTNKDGYINVKDLRRFYLFDMNGIKQQALIPKNYSVMSSEYDDKIDYMYIFTKEDNNKNGQMDSGEDVHIFWIDLKEPKNTGIFY